MDKLILEVIVTSLADAIEAQLGGADRLELVAHLEYGGLTPSMQVARDVVGGVSVPVRVMLRESRHMSVEGAAEVGRLQSAARTLSAMPINGLVTGFVTDGTIDSGTTAEVLACAPHVRATFHRAWDDVPESEKRTGTLRRMRQIDRLLTNGGAGSWKERKARLEHWRDVCSPDIQLIFAAGNELAHARELIHESGIVEIHIGRAARNPQTAAGAVDRHRVAAVRRQLVEGLL